MDHILDGLNEHQRSAVTSPSSVLQVLAPPGSGKTKTLTARVAYLIAYDKLLPWNIIVCTFTIKAAREMKERIRGFVGDSLEAKLILGTFHSVARRFLVTYGHLIGIDKKFGIADSSDSLAILKRILKRRSYNVEPSVARSRISALKARNVSCDAYAAKLKKVEEHEFANIYTAYEETLRTSNLLDYDDLLLRCADLLRRHPECVSNIEAVLIDEFQDTNHVQYELMSLFAQKKNRITIVGDPDQSIYSFRSAEIENLNRMKRDYPETHRVILEENYRSSGAILLSALEVIEQDEGRVAKNLLSTHCTGERPVLRRLPSAAAEASWIASEIQRSRALTGHLLTHSDFSILLRSAALSRHIETALGKAGIPYRMVGGHRFYDRVEVKIILDYLRVINQPDHNDALVRVINVPARRIGEATIKNLMEEAEEKKIPLWNLVFDVTRGNRKPKANLSVQAEKGLESFVNLILTSRKKLIEEDETVFSLLDLIDHVMKKLSFEEHLRKVYPEDFDSRWANVEELIAQASDMTAAIAKGEDVIEQALAAIEGVEQQKLTPVEDALGSFLANIALSTEVQKEEEAGKATEQVTLSTIHAAKGLEWPVVFIPAAYEGSIPHSRAEDTDEERRLLYVGMTRAQSLLYISCPVKTSQGEKTILSPFLSPRSMSAYFDIRGPTFRYTVAQDLARILRRPCPPEAFIQNCRTLVDRVDDDLWPLDGEEVDPGSSHWNFSASSDAFPYDHPAIKRRRVDTVDTQVSVASVTAATTMHNQGSFSISTSTLQSGFVSAGVRMKEIEKEAQNTSRAETKASQRAMTAPKKVVKSKSTEQGSLLTFFANKSISTSAMAAKQVKQSYTPQSDELNQSSQPLQDISNISLPQAIAPIPPSMLAPSVKTHKIRTKPALARRSSPEPDTNRTSQRYILLSSSPTRPDHDDQAEPPSNDLPSSPPKVERMRPIRPGLPSANDLRPASSFHTTSISQLSGHSQPQRKTLGMRRSLQGWSCKAHQSFSGTGRPK